MARLYYRHVPGLTGSAEEMLNGMPKGITRQQFMGMLMAHYDLRLAETATFKPAEVAALANRHEELVTSLLRTLSLAPGALVEMQPEFLFLGNPVWERPAIDLGDAFFIPMPQAAFSHVHRLMDRLTADAGLRGFNTKRGRAATRRNRAAILPTPHYLLERKPFVLRSIAVAPAAQIKHVLR